MRERQLYRIAYGPKEQTFLRVYGIVIATLAVIITAVLLFMLPYGSVSYGNRSEGDVNTLMTVGVIAGSQVLLLASIFIFLGGKTVPQTETHEPEKFPFMPSLISLVVMWGMAAIWVFQYLGDEGPLLIALLAVPLFLALGMLFGALAWLFVVVPLNMLVRGLYYAVIKREQGVFRVLSLPLMLLALGSLIIIMPMAVDLNGPPGKFGWSTVIKAMIGLPGNYDVINETAFIIGRIVSVVTAILIVMYIVLASRDQRARRRQANENQD